MTAALVIPSFAANTPGKIDYVAFGDSVASGVRGGVGAPGSEKGSDKGYTDGIAVRLREEGVLGDFNEDFCTSGMTAELLAKNTAVLKDPETDEAKLVKDAEIATLDIGANDLLAPLYAYVSALEDISVTGIDIDRIQEILDAMIRDLRTGTSGTEVEANIETILGNILAANSSVKIYVMGYYNPLPAVSLLYGVDLNEPTEYFNTLIQKAVSDVLAANSNASISYVPTFDAMASSAGTLAVTDIHPTESGYLVIAGEFWKQIGPLAGEYKANAVPSASLISCNGIPVPFDAYNINGNNYLKLRDVAMALGGTAKQISVSFDAAAGSVSVTTGQAYTPVGGELTLSPNKTSAVAYASPFTFSVDGVPLSLTAYFINESNYIKLRDLAQAFNIAADYDPVTNSVNMDVTKGYTPPAA